MGVDVLQLADVVVHELPQVQGVAVGILAMCYGGPKRHRPTRLAAGPGQTRPGSRPRPGHSAYPTACDHLDFDPSEVLVLALWPGVRVGVPHAGHLRVVVGSGSMSTPPGIDCSRVRSPLVLETVPPVDVTAHDPCRALVHLESAHPLVISNLEADRHAGCDDH